MTINQKYGRRHSSGIEVDSLRVMGKNPWMTYPLIQVSGFTSVKGKLK